MRMASAATNPASNPPRRLAAPSSSSTNFAAAPAASAADLSCSRMPPWLLDARPQPRMLLPAARPPRLFDLHVLFAIVAQGARVEGHGRELHGLVGEVEVARLL